MKKTTENFEAFCEKEILKVEKIFSKICANKKPKELYESCAYVLEGKGKRIRPLLVILSAKAAGGDPKRTYNAAAAVELLHNFTLVHDDIMDNSDLRRGRETLHKKYNVSAAVLAGDHLVALAYEYLLKDCGKNSKQAVSYFTKGIIEVCEGQSYDKEFELRKDVSIGEYIIMIAKKTAALSEMCCALGAELAGGSKKEIEALRKFGRNIGMAFQIQDDLLDCISDSKTLGKPIGGDLVEGKKTYLLIKALEKAEGTIKEDFLKLINNNGVERGEINKYIEYYDKLNIFQEARKTAEKYTQKALKSLKFIKRNESRKMLETLAYTLIKRNK